MEEEKTRRKSKRRSSNRRSNHRERGKRRDVFMTWLSSSEMPVSSKGDRMM